MNMIPVKLACAGLSATALMKTAHEERRNNMDSIENQEEQTISADALKKQIAKVKRCFHSENNDYMTGYLSALSVVEGMIDYLTDPTPTTEALEG